MKFLQGGGEVMGCQILGSSTCINHKSKVLLLRVWWGQVGKDTFPPLAICTLCNMGPVEWPALGGEEVKNRKPGVETVETQN